MQSGLNTYEGLFLRSAFDSGDCATFGGVMVSTDQLDHLLHARDDGWLCNKSIKTTTANDKIEMAPSVSEADAILAQFGYVDAEAEAVLS